MRYLEFIKTGIQTLNRNYQLLIIQMGALVLAFILFIIIVGIPLIIAFSKIGLELPEKGLTELFEILINNFSLYKTFALTIAISLFSYLLISLFLFVYIIAGTCGVLMNSLKVGETFSWRHFTHRGKELFGSFLRLSIFGILLFLIISFFAGLIGGITKVLSPGQGDFLENFYTNLLNLISIIFTLSIIVLFMATLTYGAGIMSIERQGALKSLKGSLIFIFKNPDALLFFVILSLTAIALTITTGLASLLFKGFSFVVYQLILSFVQIYVNLAIISSSFAYLTKEQKLISEIGGQSE